MSAKAFVAILLLAVIVAIASGSRSRIRRGQGGRGMRGARQMPMQARMRMGGMGMQGKMGGMGMQGKMGGMGMQGKMGGMGMPGKMGGMGMQRRRMVPGAMGKRFGKRFGGPLPNQGFQNQGLNEPAMLEENQAGYNSGSPDYYDSPDNSYGGQYDDPMSDDLMGELYSDFAGEDSSDGMIMEDDYYQEGELLEEEDHSLVPAATIRPGTATGMDFRAQVNAVVATAKANVAAVEIAKQSLEAGDCTTSMTAAGVNGCWDLAVSVGLDGSQHSNIINLRNKVSCQDSNPQPDDEMSYPCPGSDTQYIPTIQQALISVTEGDNTLKTTDWKCFHDVDTPLRLNLGVAECLSENGQDCMWGHCQTSIHNAPNNFDSIQCLDASSAWCFRAMKHLGILKKDANNNEMIQLGDGHSGVDCPGGWKATGGADADWCKETCYSIPCPDYPQICMCPSFDAMEKQMSTDLDAVNQAAMALIQ